MKRLDVVAARIHAHAPDRLPPFGKPELKNLWKQATELGLAIQLHFQPRWAEGFEPLIQEFHEARVIIDHLGRPFQGTPQEHAVVVRWSRFPNTVMKVSSLPAPNTDSDRDVQPVIKQLTQAYGAERMIYGGGFGAARRRSRTGERSSARPGCWRTCRRSSGPRFWERTQCGCLGLGLRSSRHAPRDEPKYLLSARKWARHAERDGYSALKAAGRRSSRSLAISETCPRAAAARSPARPCTWAPNRAASNGARP